jgi:hypothetical protein
LRLPFYHDAHSESMGPDTRNPRIFINFLMWYLRYKFHDSKGSLKPFPIDLARLWTETGHMQR